MSAYACGPGEGSEPGAGWEWARAAAERHDVVVLTRANNRTVIDEVLAASPELRMTPVYLDLPEWARWWKRGGRGVRLYYCLWQVLARRTASRLHRAAPFDVAHHITFATDWLPAAVVGIRDLPSIWGPVGGTCPVPWAFRRWLGFRAILSEVMRGASGAIGRAVFGSWTARRANVVVAQNSEVARRFARFAPLVEPNAAIDDVDNTTIGPPLEPRRAVFAGRLVAWKGLLLAIETMADERVADWHLDVYGDGPDRARAERLAAAIGVQDRVTFHGLRPRHEVLEAYAGASCMLFPSMHDSAPWSVAESISRALPVVCLPIGGPRVMVERTDGGACVNPAQIPHGLALAMIAEAKRDRITMKTQEFSSSRLGDVLDQWYSSAVA